MHTIYLCFIITENGTNSGNGLYSSHAIRTHEDYSSPPVAPVSMPKKLTSSKITSLSSNYTYTTDSVVSNATAATVTSSSFTTDDNEGANEMDGKRGSNTKRKKRQNKAQPGLTAKGLKRKFVKHNYVDRSSITHPKLADNDDSIFERYSVFNNSADKTLSLSSDSKSDIDNADATSLANSSTKVRSAPFPLKVYMILSYVAKEGLHDIMNWLPHGRAFQVFDTKGFQDNIMPRFFSMGKITSFYRQLNLYGFSRLTHGKNNGAYYHEYFLRGKPYLTINIFRVKVKGTKIRAAGSPDEEPDFHTMEPVNPTPTSNAININNIAHSKNSNYSFQSHTITTSDNKDEIAETRMNNDKHQLIHNNQLRRRTGGGYASQRMSSVQVQSNHDEDCPLPTVPNAVISKALSENDLHSPLPMNHPGILDRSGNEFIDELVHLQLLPEKGCFDSQNNHNVELSYMNELQPPQQAFQMRRHSVANGQPSEYYQQSAYPKPQWNAVAAASTSFSTIQMNNNNQQQNLYPQTSVAYPSFQGTSYVNPQQMPRHLTTRYTTYNAGFGDAGDYTTARSQHEFQSVTDDGTGTYTASNHIFDNMTEACLSNFDDQDLDTSRRYFEELEELFNNWVDDPLEEEDERNQKGDNEDLNEVNNEDLDIFKILGNKNL